MFLCARMLLFFFSFFFNKAMFLEESWPKSSPSCGATAARPQVSSAATADSAFRHGDATAPGGGQQDFVTTTCRSPTVASLLGCFGGGGGGQNKKKKVHLTPPTSPFRMLEAPPVPPTTTTSASGQQLPGSATSPAAARGCRDTEQTRAGLI